MDKYTVGNMNKIYLFLYTLCVLLTGYLHIGSLSIRVIATLLAAVFLIFSNLLKETSFWADGKSKCYMQMYFCFSVVMGFSLLINGDFEEYDFIKRFLGYYMVCIITYMYLGVSLKDISTINLLINTLIFVVIIDSLVSILQFLGNFWGWTLGNYLGADITRYVDRAERYSSDELSMMANIPGIMGSVVGNSFFIMSVAPLCLYKALSTKKVLCKILLYGCSLLCFIACFAVQERFAFFVLLLNYLALFYFRMNRHKGVFISILVIVLIFAFSNINPNSDFLGRLSFSSYTSNSDRDGFISRAVDFIFDHLLFGGPVQFEKINFGLSTHNFFFDSFIAAGLLGAIILLWLFCKILVVPIKVILQHLRKGKVLSLEIAVSLCLIASLLQGFFHNNSLLTGEVLIWILFIILLKIKTIKE